MPKCGATLSNGKDCECSAKYPEEYPKYCGHHKKLLNSSDDENEESRKCSKCKCIRSWKGKQKTCDDCRKKSSAYKNKIRSNSKICQMETRRGGVCKNLVEGKNRFCKKNHSKYEKYTNDEIKKMKRCSKCGTLELFLKNSKICETCRIKQRLYRKHKKEEKKEKKQDK